MAVWVLHSRVPALWNFLEFQALEEGRIIEWMELPSADAPVWESFSAGRTGWLHRLAVGLFNFCFQ